MKKIPNKSIDSSKSVFIRRNKVAKHKLRVNFKKKSTKLIYYPTLTLNFENINIKNPDQKKKKRRKMHLDVAEYKPHFLISFLDKKISELKLFQKNLVQIYGFNSSLSKCSTTKGTVIKLIYHGKMKLVLLAPSIDSEEELAYFCSDKLEETKTFIDFFEQLSDFPSDCVKCQLFLMSKKNYQLFNIEEVHKSGANLYAGVDSKISLFEIPNSVLELLDYRMIPEVNLNKVKNKRIRKDIFLMGTDFPYQKSTFVEKAISKRRDNHTYLKTCVTAGRINSAVEFRTSSAFGYVGSLLHDFKDIINPVGINLGEFDGRNYYLSFQNYVFCEFLKSFMAETSRDIVYVN